MSKSFGIHDPFRLQHLVMKNSTFMIRATRSESIYIYIYIYGSMLSMLVQKVKRKEGHFVRVGRIGFDGSPMAKQSQSGPKRSRTERVKCESLSLGRAISS